jgi:hypothetical protein
MSERCAEIAVFEKAGGQQDPNLSSRAGCSIDLKSPQSQFDLSPGRFPKEPLTATIGLVHGDATSTPVQAPKTASLFVSKPCP